MRNGKLLSPIEWRLIYTSPPKSRNFLWGQAKILEPEKGIWLGQQVYCSNASLLVVADNFSHVLVKIQLKRKISPLLKVRCPRRSLLLSHQHRQQVITSRKGEEGKGVASSLLLFILFETTFFWAQNATTFLNCTIYHSFEIRIK